MPLILVLTLLFWYLIFFRLIFLCPFFFWFFCWGFFFLAFRFSFFFSFFLLSRFLTLSYGSLPHYTDCNLRDVDLGYTSFGFEGVKTIFETLATNKTLHRLKIDSSLGETTREQQVELLQTLAKSLQVNKTLQNVTISMHKVKATDMDDFAAAIKENTTLTHFSIEMWGDRLLKELAPLLARNRALQGGSKEDEDEGDY